MSDESVLWERDGWRGYVTDYKQPGKVFIGLLTLRCQKGSRWIQWEGHTAEEIAAFDPEQWWKDEGVSRATRMTTADQKRKR